MSDIAESDCNLTNRTNNFIDFLGRKFRFLKYQVLQELVEEYPVPHPWYPFDVQESSKPLLIASALYSKAINGRPVIAVEETNVPQSQYSPHPL